MYKYLENFSLKAIISAFVLVFTVLVFSVSIIYLSINVKKNALNNSKAIVDSYTREKAAILKGRFNEVIAITRTLANVFADNVDKDIEQVNPQTKKFLRNTLKNNPDFVSVWLDWELSAIDSTYKKRNGRVGRFCFKENNRIKYSYDVRDTTNEELKGSYYDIKNTGKEIMGEPYYDDYTDELKGILMISPTVPIFKRNKFIGMVGVDLSMEKIRQFVKQIKPYEVSSAYLLSPEKMIVAHTDNKFYDKNIFEVKKEFSKEYKTAVNLIANNKPYSFQVKDNSGDLYVSMTPIIIGKDNEVWTLVTETPLNIVTAKSNRLFLFTILIGATGIGVLAVLIYFVLTKVTNRLRATIKFAEKLSEGDLSAKIEETGNNEIGRLAAALNLMAEKIKTIVAEISQSAGSINKSSDEISHFSNDLSNGSSTQASSVEEVMALIEEMSANIQKTTESAKETEKISTKALVGIKNGSASTHKTADSINKIAEKVSIIDEISKQTNILALNAAVEAARAGVHGKGFAVVAGEVKKLAETAQHATEEINLLTKNGVSLSDYAEKELQKIIPDIEKTAQLVYEITRASIEQNSGANQVLSAIQELNNIAQKNSSLSGRMDDKAQNLTEEAKRLKEAIKYFKL